MGIPAERVIVMGDSGGDGPHFEWAHQAGAFIISSMTKPSLGGLLRQQRDHHRKALRLGHGKNEARDLKREMAVDFRGPDRLDQGSSQRVSPL